ncbi:MAG: alkaline phosphatase family protein [Cyclobacteriaceae bacterium]|nr:alkaline phosphatase family protein [Cyclobacteriaceae bacterium]
MKRLLLIFSGFFLIIPLWAQLQSGPMVGYSTMKEVLLWVQTSEPAEVQFRYWEKDQDQTKQHTVKKRSDPFTAHAVKLVADNVEPGRIYEYELLIDGVVIDIDYPLEFQTQTLWHIRGDPPDFSFALGSCNYINETITDRPGDPYGGGYEIFENIRAQEPDFMVWLGDNVYLREADWNSRRGILERYTHTRSVPEVQPLLGSVHHYAIWDDHDYGPNDSDRSYWNKEITTETFKLFWGNPNYNVTGAGGITGTFYWGDVQFFLIDDRYFRAPNNDMDSTKSLMGEAQLQWLKDALTYSRAAFKFICIGGQVLNTGAVFENYATYPVERKKLLEAIADSGAWGVIFLTGDRHHTELSKLDRAGLYPLYDFTVSPLTSSSHTPDEGENSLTQEGTLVTQRNFGVVKVSGPRKERVLILEIRDVSGELLWEKKLTTKDLRPPKN